MRSQNTNRWFTQAAAMIVMIGLLTFGAMPKSSQAQSGSASLVTDQDDVLGGYVAGDPVTIVGFGFEANENVSLQVIHADGRAESGMGHDPSSMTADDKGVFVARWVINPNDSAGNAFVAKATGAVSHASATVAIGRAATVRTDTFNYHPGQTAHITGTGFRPGEVVSIQVLAVPNNDPTADEHKALPFSTDSNDTVTAGWYVTTDELERMR